MAILRSPVFIVCCILFVLHQLLQKVFQVPVPLIDAYLDSFLSMPILLTLLVVERRLLFKRGESYRLNAMDVVIVTLFVACVAELAFPAFSARFTPDWWDVVAYVLGSLLFYFTINGYPYSKLGTRTESK